MEDKLDELKQPQTLEECFTLLSEMLSDREHFKNLLEGNAMAMAHHGLGRFIRNGWYLWWTKEIAEEYKAHNYPQEKPAIVKYFNETWDITHGDDISGVILTSYHRHLNGRDLNIKEQVDKYKAHWGKYGK